MFMLIAVLRWWPGLEFAAGLALQQVRPQRRASGAVSAPGQAIDALKKDPRLAAQFDAKYGPGASKQYLGS
jgi:hypothetical protein